MVWNGKSASPMPAAMVRPMIAGMVIVLQATARGNGRAARA
jgi:hypothetical protein